MNNTTTGVIFDPVASAIFVSGPNNEPVSAKVYDEDMAAVDPEFAQWYDQELGILQRYAILAENPADLTDESRRSDLLAKLSFGLRRSGDMLARIKGRLRKAESLLKQASALAAIDDLNEHSARMTMSGEKLKITDDYRKTFVAGSPRLHKANLNCAMLIAMSEQAWTMKTEFMMGISTVKAIAWGMRDSEHLSSGAAPEER
jgi:hypothetical protein